MAATFESASSSDRVAGRFHCNPVSAPARPRAFAKGGACENSQRVCSREPIANVSPSAQMHASRAFCSESSSSTDRVEDFAADRADDYNDDMSSEEKEQTKTARVFPRRKLGEAARGSDVPVLLTMETLQPYFAMSMKEASKLMVRLFPDQAPSRETVTRNRNTSRCPCHEPLPLKRRPA